jgi:hypothetical protein
MRFPYRPLHVPIFLFLSVIHTSAKGIFLKRGLGCCQCIRAGVLRPDWHRAGLAKAGYGSTTVIAFYFWKALYCIFRGVRSVRLGLIRVVPILWEVRNDYWSPFYATACTSTQETC